jgi:hypothetical protein
LRRRLRDSAAFTEGDHGCDDLIIADRVEGSGVRSRRNRRAPIIGLSISLGLTSLLLFPVDALYINLEEFLGLSWLRLDGNLLIVAIGILVLVGL